MTALVTPNARSRGNRKEQFAALAMFLPAGVLILTFLVIPIALTFILAFTNTRLISPEPGRFIGLENFANLFTDDTFWAALRNTVIFTIVVVPVQSGLALLVAVLVNSKVRGTTFFRTCTSCQSSPRSSSCRCSGCSFIKGTG